MRRVLLLLLLLIPLSGNAEQPIRIISPRDGFIKRGPVHVHLLVREHSENVGVLLVWESEDLDGGSSWIPLPTIPKTIQLHSGKWEIVATLHAVRGGKTYVRGSDHVTVSVM